MSLFVDKTDIFVKAGKGGNGSVSFRREKYVAKGGPDGGDGGHGGNIVLVVDSGENTLVRFRYKHKFVAGNGEDGKAAKCHGKTAPDLEIPVPPGTVVRDKESGQVIFDMSKRPRFVLCHGGRGGWGNTHFKTPTRQIPRFAKPGLPGEEREVTLELKMLADVGLIGFPSVGKSTLISRVSSARPKIAGYHFTTLSPVLGVVQVSREKSFVMADIPGLIEGASDGAGLGHEFLRHVERCRLFIHVIDGAGSEGRDPVEDMKIINRELIRHSVELKDRKEIVAVNKTDLGITDEMKKRIEEYCAEQGLEFFYISAENNIGVDKLIERCAKLLETLPPIKEYETEFVPKEPDLGDRSVTVEREGDIWIVEGEWLSNFMDRINFSDRESLRHFQKVIKDSGIEEQMLKAGVKDGDTVNLCGMEFEYMY